VATLDKGIAERLNQLVKLKDKIEALDEQRSESQKAFCRMWPQKMSQFADLQRHGGDKRKLDGFLKAIEASNKENGPLYIDTIQGLSRSQAELGSQWLQGIVEYIVSEISK
jgi:hypothetical protein